MGQPREVTPVFEGQVQFVSEGKEETTDNCFWHKRVRVIVTKRELGGGVISLGVLFPLGQPWEQ